jgi:hypothetical protein
VVDTSFQVQTLCNVIILKNQVIKMGTDIVGIIAYSLKSVICIAIVDLQ